MKFLLQIQVRLLQLVFPLIIFSVLLIISCNNTKTQEITILAAASLADALSEIEKAYESQNEIDLLISYGGSQMLANQIVHGAKTDLFIPAGYTPLTKLENTAILEKVYPLLTNSLVLVTHTSNTSSKVYCRRCVSVLGVRFIKCKLMFIFLNLYSLICGVCGFK